MWFFQAKSKSLTHLVAPWCLCHFAYFLSCPHPDQLYIWLSSQEKSRWLGSIDREGCSGVPGHSHRAGAGFPGLTGLPAGKEQVLQAFLPMALVIGAISAATAPGAVLAIISKLRARVPFTTTLLGVIALDDALTIILFIVAGTVAHGLIGPDSMEIAHMMRIPAMEIGLSLAMGTACGLALKHMGRITNRGESAIMVVSGMALLIRKNQAHMRAKVADCH